MLAASGVGDGAGPGDVTQPTFGAPSRRSLQLALPQRVVKGVRDLHQSRHLLRREAHSSEVETQEPDTTQRRNQGLSPPVTGSDRHRAITSALVLIVCRLSCVHS